MADIGRVLYTAREALLSNLTAINVTGSNIANVNTPGYTRVRPMFESVGTSDATSMQEQVGVRIADVERIYNKFLESQMVSQQSSLANYTAQEDILARIEGVLNENAGGGINDALGEFLNAWGNLSVDPLSKSKRDMVVSTGENISSLFNQRAEELRNIQTDADTSIADALQILNGYLEEMADYNELIVSAENSGSSASSIRDKRGDLLNKIASIIDINYIEKSDGSLYVYLPENGKALVEGVNSWELQVHANPLNNNLYDIVFPDNPLQAINNQISGGKLAGLLEIRDTAIPSYLNQINLTASSIIDRVNELHTAGYDQDGVPGEMFFDYDPADAARSMLVSADISADTRKIAASATVYADGNNATAITAIKNEINPTLGVSIDGYFNAFIADMGQDVVNARQAVTRETTILNQQTDQREQVSGVSLDEEMMNLIKYQMAYGAAGKMTTTVNDLIDILLNLVR